jgi:CheY-like chemotaxis protein
MTADRRHALIIEDELLIGLELQAQLSQLGYGSFAFAGAEQQAVEQAALRCPHLVTVDVTLLDGDGVDAIDEVLRLCGPLPVIYVTGDGESLMRRRPDAVVVEKPVSDAALAFALTRAKAQPARPRAARSRGGEPQPYRPVT